MSQRREDKRSEKLRQAVTETPAERKARAETAADRIARLERNPEVLVGGETPGLGEGRSRAPEPGEGGHAPAVRRDTISMPPADFEELETLRFRLSRPGRLVGKSEAVRLAIAAASRLPTEELLKVLEELPRVPVGRQSKKS